MFRFEHSEYYFLLSVIPVIIGLYLLYRYLRKRDLKNIGDDQLVDRLIEGGSRYKALSKLTLLILCLVFAIIALSNPQWGNRKEKVKAKSADIMIAIDISQSMMAEDITPNRLEKVKRFGQKLIEELKGERIGLILFAGEAYLQMPLTMDYSAANIFVRSANTSLAGTQGTAIAQAIDLAERSFEPESKNHKALIIISDGENHEPAAIENAEEAANNGLRIFTLGAGTAEGGFIPVVNRGRSNYKKDKEGKPVKSKMNDALLKDLARIGKGSYFHISNDNEAIETIKEQIDQMEKREIEQRSYTDFSSYFQYFLGIGILLLIIEFLISNRRSNWFNKKDIFDI